VGSGCPLLQVPVFSKLGHGDALAVGGLQKKFVASEGIMRFRNLRLQMRSFGLCCCSMKYDVAMLDDGFEYFWNFF